MVLVDIAVVASLVLVFLVGLRNGLCAGTIILLGTIAGGAVAAALVPSVASGLLVASWGGPVTVLLSVALLALGAGAGLGVGRLVRRRIGRTPLRIAERSLGGVAAVLVGAVLISFAASTIVAFAPSATAAAVGSSRVVQVIAALTPPPVEAGMTRLRGALVDAGLSRWVAQVASPLTPPSRPLDVEDPALQRAGRSVVLVTGVASSCGRSIMGSGFAVAPGRFVTNAHVVAGVDSPVVQTADGEVADGRVVYFDPQLDLAVIAADELSAPPLALLMTGLTTGAAGVVLGYPEGGPLTSLPAEVLWRTLVTVPGVSAGAGPPRDVYALDADVLPGNSGGPLVSEDGRVAGLVFARGDDGAGLGYAMTDAPLRPIAEHAARWSTPVDTGACSG